MRKQYVKLCSKSRECWEILVNGATEALIRKLSMAKWVGGSWSGQLY